MNLKIFSKSDIPIYEQIERQLKQEILEGNIKSGEALPSIRSLAADLKISVITTKRAYEELEKDGMIYSVPGKGFFVDNPDIQYLAEKRTLNIETELSSLLSDVKRAGIKKDEFIDMINILWED
jgi:predicted transcriptional regulators